MERVKKFGDIKLNLGRALTFLSRNISFSYSPLVRELVRLDDGSKQEIYTDLQSCTLGRTGLFDANKSDEEAYDEHWLRYLTKPVTLCGLIKKYHSTGNLFFVSVLLQFALLGYICAKALFHQIYTGNNKQLSKYHAQNYYPRLFSAYDESNELYGVLTSVCFFHLILRLKKFLGLVRSSVVNRNGYKEIEIPQLNQFFFTLVLPLKDWLRLIRIGRKHSKICQKLAADERATAERETHLRAGLDNSDGLSKLSKHTQILYLNPINFEHCFRYLGVNIDERKSLGDNLYLLKSDCREDVLEFAWFAFFHSVGALLLSTIIYSVFLYTCFRALVPLTSNPNEATLYDCLYAIPSLIGDPISLLPLVDVLILLVLQLPYHFEADILYMSLSCMISRIRRVAEMLEEELGFCRRKNNAHLRNTIVLSGTKERLDKSTIVGQKVLFAPVRGEFGCYKDINSHERAQLNRRLEQYVKLARVLRIEFVILKKSLTGYLNILMIGSGIIIAIGVLSFLRIQSFDLRAYLILLLGSCAYPILTCASLCVLVERGVSNPFMGADVCEMIATMAQQTN